jgi:hypothetical protein
MKSPPPRCYKKAAALATPLLAPLYDLTTASTDVHCARGDLLLTPVYGLRQAQIGSDLAPTYTGEDVMGNPVTKICLTASQSTTLSTGVPCWS